MILFIVWKEYWKAIKSYEKKYEQCLGDMFSLMGVNPFVGLVRLWQNIIFVMLCGPAISEYITNIIRAQGHYTANVWNPGPLTQEYATLPPGHRCCIKCQISCISFVIFIKPVVCI